MADGDRILKILLQLQADTTDLQGKLNPALDQTKAKLAEVSAAGEVAAVETGALGAVLGEIASVAVFTGIGALVAALTALPALLLRSAEESARANEEIKKTIEDAADLQRVVDKYDEMANAAKNFGDVTKLGEQLRPGIDDAATKLEIFRAQQLAAFQTWAGYIKEIFSGIAAGIAASQSDLYQTSPALAQGQADATRTAAEDKLKKDLQDRLDLGNKILDQAKATEAEYEKFQSLPPSQGLAFYTDRVKNLEAALAGLEEKRKTDSAAYDQYQKLSQDLVTARARVDEFRNSNDSLKSSLEKTSQQATLTEDKLSGDGPKLAFDSATFAVQKLRTEWEKIGPITDEQEAALKRIFDDTYANVLAQQKHTEASKGTSDAHRDIVAFLAEESALLRQMHQQEQLTQQNPFLSADQKEASEIKSIPQQIEEINKEIQKGRDDLAGSALDPATYARTSAGIQKLQFDAASLGQKLSALTQPLRAGLTEWVNQFGSSMHQLSNLVTSTLTIAVNQLSSAITGLIFKTTTWKQAFASAAQAIIGNIIQILVQWIASQTIMLALNAIFGKTAGQTSSKLAAQSAAQWAPAATSASIASYGAAAGFGTIAYIAALAAGTAAAVGLSGGGGGFEGGGFTGGQRGRIAGFVHGEEYVFSAPATRAIGVQNLEALHQTFVRSSYESGGFVGPSSAGGAPSGLASSAQRPVINQALFLDVGEARKWLLDRAGERHIIDIIGRNRVELGLA